MKQENRKRKEDKYSYVSNEEYDYAADFAHWRAGLGSIDKETTGYVSVEENNNLIIAFGIIASASMILLGFSFIYLVGRL